ncbi:MAG: hypothetical protein DRP12_01770 [Candidatus Aenigmatarchaeota archaeon]|nr:MAG: hypothetical protein DRP12_01770 [Candidatus Aenigmarchaeota archaeon]
MRGISATLLIIITAVVLLVAALVLLTIFGGGIAPWGTMVNPYNYCYQQCQSTCSTTGNLPPNWFVATQKTDQGLKSCAEITGVKSCSDCLR